MMVLTSLGTLWSDEEEEEEEEEEELTAIPLVIYFDSGGGFRALTLNVDFEALSFS